MQGGAAPHLLLMAMVVRCNIVDLSSLTPFPGFVAHSAAKATLLNLTYSLAIKMAPKVRVNAVAPGPVLPPPGYTEEQIGLAKRTTGWSVGYWTPCPVVGFLRRVGVHHRRTDPGRRRRDVGLAQMGLLRVSRRTRRGP